MNLSNKLIYRTVDLSSNPFYIDRPLNQFNSIREYVWLSRFNSFLIHCRPVGLGYRSIQLDPVATGGDHSRLALSRLSQAVSTEHTKAASSRSSRRHLYRPFLLRTSDVALVHSSRRHLFGSRVLPKKICPFSHIFLLDGLLKRPSHLPSPLRLRQLLA